MNEDDMKREICCVFKGPMGGDPQFPFEFLQSAGEGTKTLVVPAQSSNCQWTPQQVACLGGQKSTIIYVLAEADMRFLRDPEVSSY